MLSYDQNRGLNLLRVRHGVGWPLSVKNVWCHHIVSSDANRCDSLCLHVFFVFFLFSCYSFRFVLPKRNWPLNRIVYWDDKNMEKYTTGVLTWRQLSWRDCLSLFVSGEKYKLVSYVQLNERSTVRRDLCDKGLWRGRSRWLREG